MPGRDVRLRLNDYYEVYAPADPQAAQQEGGRCMNCGAAFCMPDSGYGEGCPLHNRIPEWNELVRLGRWEDAYHRLALTNPFPEFTARVCPAPCQDACIFGLNEKPIQIKGIERAIIDRAFAEGWVRPAAPAERTGGRVAVVGSGPAGLAAADRLNAMGHAVTIYERSDRPGGLLRYGVPNMKLDKAVLDRRIDLMRQAGVAFVLDCSVGRDIAADELGRRYDAVLLACGALRPRELDVPGRSLRGIYQAIPYLTASMQAVQSGSTPAIDARGKRVVIIGAGDTGADCIATALRQGAASVVNLARGQAPPARRDTDHPWPMPAGTLTHDYAHQEAAAAHGSDPRWWRSSTRSFIPHPVHADHVGGVLLTDQSGQQQQIPADLVLLSIGFAGHDNQPLLDQLLPDATEPARASGASPSASPRVFIAGDMALGPSLVVHAIAEGLRAATKIHHCIAG